MATSGSDSYLATSENVNYLRVILLLLEGGSYISKTILSRQLGQQNIDTLLSTFESKLKHELHQKQFRKLFPVSGKTDTKTWDLQMLTVVILRLFHHSLTREERKNLNVLKDLRNNVLAHKSSASLDYVEYEDIQDQLKDALTVLASGCDHTVRTECERLICGFLSGPLDNDCTKRYLQHIKDVDEVFRKVMEILDQMMQSILSINTSTSTSTAATSTAATSTAAISSLHEQVAELKKYIGILERQMEKRKDKFDKEVKVATNVDLTISGPSQELVEYTEKLLTCIFNGTDSSEGEFGEIKRHVKRLVTDLESKGIRLKQSSRKCIILQLECTTYNAVLDFLCYMSSKQYQEWLEKLAQSFRRIYQLREELNISSKIPISCLENLKDAVEKEWELALTDRQQHDDLNLLENANKTPAEVYNTSLKLELECRSVDGLSQLLDFFHEGKATNHLNGIAEVLSSHFSTPVTLSSSLNFTDLKNALKTSFSGVATEKTHKQKDEPEPEKNIERASKEDPIDLGEKDIHQDKSTIQSEVKHLTGKSLWLSKREKQKEGRTHGLRPLNARREYRKRMEIIAHESSLWLPNVRRKDDFASDFMRRESTRYTGYTVGVCAPTKYKEEEYGCLIVSDLERNTDTIGGKRFKVINRDYFGCRAVVEIINDKPPADVQELKELSHSVYSECKSWYASLPAVFQEHLCDTFGNFPSPESDDSYGEDGPAWHWWVAAALPMSIKEKITMIATESYKERLLTLEKALGRELPSLKQECTGTRIDVTTTRAVKENEDFIAILNHCHEACSRKFDRFCEILQEAGLRLEIFTEMSYVAIESLIKAKGIILCKSSYSKGKSVFGLASKREKVMIVLFDGAVVRKSESVYIYPDDVLGVARHLLAEEGSEIHPEKTKLQSNEKYPTEEIVELTKAEEQADECNKGQQLALRLAGLEVEERTFEIILVSTLCYPCVKQNLSRSKEVNLLLSYSFLADNIVWNFKVGACAQIGNHFADYGCIIEGIEEKKNWFSETETTGGKRFKVLHKTKMGGCTIARVNLIQDRQPEDSKEMQALSNEVYSLCRLWHDSLPFQNRFHLVNTFGEFPKQDDYVYGKDGTTWHWWMVAALPMSTEEKVSVLAMDSYKERLLIIKKAIGQYEPSVVTPDMKTPMETSLTLLKFKHFFDLE